MAFPGLLPAKNLRNHIPALDGLRGAAVAAVFLYHYGGGARSTNVALHSVGLLIHLGWAGVSLFFVLSGFLISGILLDSFAQPGWWKAFYRRRALRIFPLYYASLVGGVVVFLLLRTSRPGVAAIWPFLFYLQDIPGVVRFEALNPRLLLGHLWSLAVEEQFYLIWPGLLSFANRRNRVRELCLLVCGLSLVYRAGVFTFHLNWQWAGYFVAGRAGEMAAGGLLAASLRHSRQATEQVFRSAKFLLAASSLGAVTVMLATHQNEAGEPWFGTLGVFFLSGLFVALIAQVLQPGWWQRAFEARWLRRLGNISYGVYVYQVLLNPIFVWLTVRIWPAAVGARYQLLLAGVAAAGTLVAASLSFTFVERPFLRRRELSVRNTVEAPREVLVG